MTALAAVLLWRSVDRNVRFFLSRDRFLLGYLGLGIGLFPDIVPPGVTIWEASNTPLPQMFTLVGFSFTRPMTLIYTGYACWVCRGQVAEGVEPGGYR